MQALGRTSSSHVPPPPPRFSHDNGVT
jgi:hypothetical protein